MSEPLKGKKHYEVNNPPCRYGEFNYEYFNYDDVKSVVEWLIQQHEEEIEDEISWLEKYAEEEEIDDIIENIEHEYYAIMLIEETFSDVI